MIAQLLPVGFTWRDILSIAWDIIRGIGLYIMAEYGQFAVIVCLAVGTIGAFLYFCYLFIREAIK